MHVGEYLKSEREKRGISLEEVARITKVTIRYLQTIEAGSVEGLPSTIFVRGFVKDYAKTIGLDGDDIVKRFDAEKKIVRSNHVAYHSPLGLDEQRVAASAANAAKDAVTPQRGVKRSVVCVSTARKKREYFSKAKALLKRHVTGRVVFFIIALIVVGLAAFCSAR